MSNAIISKFARKKLSYSKLKERSSASPSARDIPMHKKSFFFILLLKDGGKTRTELIKLSGFPQTTVYDHLARLKQFNVVYAPDTLRCDARGRPQKIWYLTTDWKQGLRTLIDVYKQHFHVSENEVLDFNHNDDPILKSGDVA